MQILYLSSAYVPSRRASSIQVMKMCDALVRQGHQVTLVSKRSARRLETGVDDDHAFYGVAPGFAIDKLARPAGRGGGVVFAAAVAVRLARCRRSIDLVYCRDPLGAVMAAQVGLPVVFEAHGMPRSRAARALWRRIVHAPSTRGVVAISEALRRDLIAAELAPPGGVIVAHDGADPPHVQDRAPRALGRPPRVGYVGNLYPGRGVELILALAARMPGLGFDVVGGSEADLARVRAGALPANVVLHGFYPPGRLASIYRQLDVVLMPYARRGIQVAAGGADTSRWASPMKMFEAMAAGVPIVASDLPVLQEVLTDGVNALIADVDHLDRWQAAVERLLLDEPLRQRLIDRALDDIRTSYSWDARARHVLGSLGLPGQKAAVTPTTAS